MQNYKLTLCYDGGRYSGWQKQGNTPGTIQEKLESHLSKLLKQEVEIAGSGRTDAGVHARMQVCSFRADTGLRPDELLSLLRRYLPEDIGALSLETAPPRFHARLNCKEKTYMYRVWNSEAPNIFERHYLYLFPEPLDLDRMRQAAEYLTGRHDFTSFCSNKRMKKSPVRNLKRISIEKNGDELRLCLTGDGFLYNMVRIIVGTLLLTGTGQISPEEIPAILAARDRSKAGPTAPAQGLMLWEVCY